MKMEKSKEQGTVNILIRSYTPGGGQKSEKMLTIYDTTWRKVYRVVAKALKTKAEEDADEQENR